MSILTKKKNGGNNKAKTISIPRKKQNMHKTRKNIGKSRKNMGVKTMRGGFKFLGFKLGKNKDPKVKLGEASKTVALPSAPKGTDPFGVEFKTNPLYGVANGNVAGKPNPPGGNARKVGTPTALNFPQQPVAVSIPVTSKVIREAILPDGRRVSMLAAPLSKKLVRNLRPGAFITTLPMTHTQLSSMQTKNSPTSAQIAAYMKTAGPNRKENS